MTTLLAVTPLLCCNRQDQKGCTYSDSALSLWLPSREAEHPEARRYLRETYHSPETPEAGAEGGIYDSTWSNEVQVMKAELAERYTASVVQDVARFPADVASRVEDDLQNAAGECEAYCIASRF